MAKTFAYLLLTMDCGHSRQTRHRYNVLEVTEHRQYWVETLSRCDICNQSRIVKQVALAGGEVTK